jgi:hypothetical protein
MTTPPNIDRFNKVTLLTLDTLYEAFPVPKTLDVAKLALDTLPPDAEFDESFQSIEVAYWAVDFLVSEGFITHKGATLDGQSFSLARLTSKSLAVLGSTPSSLEHQQTMAERIRAVLKTGAKQATSEGAKKLIEALFSNAPALVNFVSAGGTP